MQQGNDTHRAMDCAQDNVLHTALTHRNRGDIRQAAATRVPCVDVPRPMRATRRRLFVAWLAVALWMIVIFRFSAQTGGTSQTQSHGVGYYVLCVMDAQFEMLPRAQQNARVESLQTIIRKGAHIAEYALLAALFWNALWRTFAARQEAARTRRSLRGARNACLPCEPCDSQYAVEEPRSTQGTCGTHATQEARTVYGASDADDMQKTHDADSGRGDRSVGFIGQTGAAAAAALAAVLSVGYAAADEWHQSFVPGRSPQLADVGIDALGALLGAALCLVLCAGVQRIRHRHKRAGRAQEHGSGAVSCERQR